MNPFLEVMLFTTAGLALLVVVVKAATSDIVTSSWALLPALKLGGIILTTLVALFTMGLVAGMITAVVILWQLSPLLAIVGGLSVAAAAVSFGAWWRRRADDPWERELYGRGWDIDRRNDPPGPR
jgi:hypothetical protein